MNPKFKFVSSDEVSKGKSTYMKEDMTIEYVTEIPAAKDSKRAVLSDAIDKQFNVKERTQFLLIADTLTMTFSGDDYRLSAIDAYTNRKRWQLSTTNEIPKVNGRGFLLVDTSSFEGDRFSLGVVPKYETAQNQRYVRIILREEECECHYEVASGLLVGLRDREIASIYLLDIAFV